MYDHDAQDYLMFTFELRIKTNLGSIYEEKKDFPKGFGIFQCLFESIGRFFCVSRLFPGTARVNRRLHQKGQIEDGNGG